MIYRRQFLPSFLLYNEIMKSIIDTAYQKLNELTKTGVPSWETYARIADLSASLKYLLSQQDMSSGEITTLIHDMRNSFGDEKTLDVLTVTLADFKNDLDCVSPQLINCFLKKLKENI